MAQLYPDIETIKRLHQPPTDGELALLDFLCQELNDDYEIFFQPMINGDCPDIVIMRKRGGVVIFEVKDWNLNNYFIDEKTKWRLKADKTTSIKSPLSQVNHYKDNLFNLHIEDLLEKKRRNKFYYAIISCGVYFHNEKEASVKNFLLGNFQKPEYDKYRKFVSYFHLCGTDSLNIQSLNKLINKSRINSTSQLFDDILYQSFKRYLKPPYHQIEEGIPITYSTPQTELIRSVANQKRKIKGFAGCGKTMVLAKRAVNAHKRIQSEVLILTYNLSLINYIHDRINDVREGFYWSSFTIINYHQFFLAMANNYNLEVTSLGAFQNPDFFEAVKSKIKPYKAVFIDEAQDYQTQWFEVITRYFMNAETEFVVFGDEKQNIYKRSMDNYGEPIIKTIPGRWNQTLNQSRRFTPQIGTLALRFQNQFLSRKYSVDELDILENPELDFDQQTIEYYNIPHANSNIVFNKYKNIVRDRSIHPSDIAVLSAKVECVRELDFLIRKELKEKTEITFESKELFDSFVQEDYKEDRLKQELEDIRRNKKKHFWMKTGTTKLSTTHSFKGWESHTVFLIIENEEDDIDDFTSDELIYTGITRARVNLFIFNFGNEKYDRFFSNYSD